MKKKNEYDHDHINGLLRRRESYRALLRELELERATLDVTIASQYKTLREIGRHLLRAEYEGL